MGNDEKPNEKSPRGIRGFELIGGANFTTWKVQGKFGGYTAFVSFPFVLNIQAD